MTARGGGKGLLQSWPQRPHFPPSCEQAASHYPHLPRILDGSYLPGVLQPETSLAEEMYSPPGTVPSQHPWDPEELGSEKCTLPWAVATLLWSTHSEHSPHIEAVFVCTVPLHSTTEQVSPNKRPLSPPHVRAEIRH